MSVKDANLYVRTAAALTADSVQPIVTLKGGTGLEGMAVLVQVPSVVGKTSVTRNLVVSIRASSSSNPETTEEIARGKAITAAGTYAIPFVSDKPYFEINADVTVGTSGGSFGVTLISIVGKAYLGNDRSVQFI